MSRNALRRVRVYRWCFVAWQNYQFQRSKRSDVTATAELCTAGSRIVERRGKSNQRVKWGDMMSFDWLHAFG